MQSLMEWYYSDQGRQAGPLSDSELENLQRSGRIGATTLVWRAGMAEWEPLQRARPSLFPSVPSKVDAPPVIGAPAAGSNFCVECRRQFPQSEMIYLNRSWVCGTCKPLFVQRLKEGAAPAGGDVWRDGRKFVLIQGTELPDRCVKCNSPANGDRLKRRLFWHHPAVYLLIFLNLLIYAIVALCIRKRATIQIGVCERHRRQRVWTIAGSWIAALIGIVLFIAGLNADSGAACAAGVFLVLGGAIYGAFRGPLVAAAKIDNDTVWVRGGGRSFLESLPDWPGGK